MADVLEYKGYIGSVHFSAEDSVLFGKLEGIGDLVSFEGRSVDELGAAFREAVDDYVSLCAMAGKDPEKCFKGSFNVRIRSELHRLAFRQAVREGKTLNQFVQDAVEREVRERAPEYAAKEAVKDRNPDPLIQSYTESLMTLLGPRLKELWLFGSRARGDYREDSDYDILVVADAERKEVEETIDPENGRMLEQFFKLFSCVVYTPEIWASAAHGPLGMNVRAQGLRLV